MRTTVVIMAIISLLSIVLDRAREAGPEADVVTLSGPVSEPATSVAEGIALKSEEGNDASHGVVHLREKQVIADLGSFLLIGVALAGLIAAPRRESRKARAGRRIT